MKFDLINFVVKVKFDLINFVVMYIRKLIKQTGLHFLKKKFHSSTYKCLHFVQFTKVGAPSTVSLGVLSDDRKSVINLSDVNPNIPNTLVKFLRDGSQLENEVQK